MNEDSSIIEITSLAYGGRGVGRRSDGKVVFVPMVVPGDVVRVTVDKEHASYCEATLQEIITPSVQRVEPQCPLFEQCGGCDWQHIDYAEQLQWKERILLAEISRNTGMQPETVFPAAASLKPFGYRSHAVLQSSFDGELQCGFYAKRSHRMVAFDSCPILAPRLQKTLDDLRHQLNFHPLPNLTSLEIFAPQDEVLVHARCRGRAGDRDAVTLNALYSALDVAGISFTVVGDKRKDYVAGQRWCGYDVPAGERTLRLASAFGGFIQANMDVNAAMVAHVLTLGAGASRVVDLYSGSGNFSLPLSTMVDSVTAIERNSRLVTVGRRCAKKNECSNVRFINMESLKALRSMVDEQVDFDTVVLDPPREGARDLIPLLVKSSVQRVIYISCNPTTLARDLGMLTREGFRLKTAQAFDMFPQTYHIEAVCSLER